MMLEMHSTKYMAEEDYCELYNAGPSQEGIAASGQSLHKLPLLLLLK